MTRAPALHVALVLAILVTYAPALRSGLVWDDAEHVVSNRALDAATPAEGLRLVWTTPGATPQYYPLTHTTFWLDRRVLGSPPSAMHLVNLLLHAACALILRSVLARLAVPGAWLAAALFALHPIQVETVAWISERKNLLSALFTLLATLGFLRFSGLDPGRTATPATAAEPTPPPRPGRLAAATLASFVAALLAKTVACTLPATLWVLLRWKRRPARAGTGMVLLAMFGLGGALALVTITVEHVVVGARGPGFDLSFAQRLVLAGRAFWFYLGRLAWPAAPSFVYPRWSIEPASWQALFPIAALAAFALAALARRRRPGDAPLVAAAIYTITLFPALGFFDVYPMRFSFVADHFAYLAVVAPLTLAAAAGTQATRAHPRPARAGALLLLAVLATLSFARTRAFESAETLWRDTLTKNPAAWLARNNLGVLLRDDGHLEEAETQLREATRLEPAEALSWTNLGSVLAARGSLEAAVAAHRRALALEPAYPQALTDLGVALARLGREDEAVELWQRALALRPDLTAAHVGLGRALVRQGRRDLGLAHLEEALRERPGDPAAAAALAEATGR